MSRSLKDRGFTDEEIKERVRAQKRAWYEKNGRAYSARNKEKIAQQRADWYVANKDHARETCRAYRDSHKEEEKVRYKAWAEKNRGKRNALNAKRRACRIERTPCWYNDVACAVIYRKAKLLEKKYGQKFHVDHYYPLKGRSVSGLHVASNLWCLTEEENASKHNKHPDRWIKELKRKGLAVPNWQL